MPDLFVSGFAHLIPMLSKRLKETSQGTSNQQEFEQSHMAVSSSARTGYVGKFTGLFSSKKAKKQLCLGGILQKNVHSCYTLQYLS